MKNLEKRMKNTYSFILLFILVGYAGKAQVKDISFTISPAAEYTWWDNQAGLEDNVMVGGKLGFGFGEYLELRGIYMQSLDQQTSFEEFGLDLFDASLFDAQNVDITRWGGEFKANLGTKRFSPYVTLGTGVQNISLDNGSDFEQIYATAGLGLKLNLAKRLVFAVEAKNTTYRFNSGVNLLTDANKTDYGVTDANFGTERLSNWSVQGSLQFYLGGRKPGELSELDKAYLQKFKGGFKGLQFIIEPSMAYANFDDGSLLRDTYLIGGYAGIDFNEYIGIRGFYFQATENEQLSTNFDDLSMYGAEFRARLNDGNGVVPFLILGGGYLNPSDNYVTSTAINNVNIVSAQSGAFASGGLGLNIPLGRNVLISGGARAMFTSGDNVTDINNTDDIQTSIFYNAGLKFTLGKKAKSPQKVYEDNVDRIVSEQQAQNEQKLNTLKADYAAEIKRLEQELKAAYDAKDVDKAVEILEEKKVLEQSLQEVKDIEKVQEKVQDVKKLEQAKQKDEIIVKEKTTAVTNDSTVHLVRRELSDREKLALIQPSPKATTELIQMTPAEFESLIERILNGINDEENTNGQTPAVKIITETKGTDQMQLENLNKRMDVLEKLLLELNQKKKPNATDQGAINTDKTNQMSDVLVRKLDDLNRKIDRNATQINTEVDAVDSKGKLAKTIVVTPANEEKIITTFDENGEILKTDKVGTANDNDSDVLINSDSTGDRFLSYDSTSILGGYSFGDFSFTHAGLRMQYDIKRTGLQFVPEVFVGFGDATFWGASANVVYPFSVAQGKFTPYVGAGLGFGDLGNSTTGLYNVLIGTSLPVLNNNLFIDYTMRNTFSHNQLSLGYRVKF